MIIHRDLWRVDSHEPQHQSHLCLPENNNFLSKRESSLVLYVFDHQRDDYSTWNIYDVTGLGMDIFVLPKLMNILLSMETCVWLNCKLEHQTKQKTKMKKTKQKTTTLCACNYIAYISTKKQSVTIPIMSAISWIGRMQVWLFLCIL